jgi:nucleoside transporter
MNIGIKSRLSFMMFLEFFIWGSWYVTMGTFLGANLKSSGSEIAAAFSTQSFGAIIAPFIIGLIADRFFNAEKILGALHLIGAILMFFLYTSTEFIHFYWVVFIYMVLYMPTLSLVNAISFRKLTSPEKEFSFIRVWGTIGWIMAGLTISFVFHWDAPTQIEQGLLQNTFLMASITSLILGIYSFTLPATPPAIKKGEKVKIADILGLDALKLFKDKNYSIFFISSILICIPLAFYYQNANPFLAEIGVADPTGKMTLGQVSEALFLLLLPIFFKKFGFKKTLMAGMLAWGIRYGLFAFGNEGEYLYLLILGIVLHGLCYDFFFVVGQIYTDAKAGPHVKSSAQGLITLATYGVGMLIGFYMAGKITDYYLTPDGLHDWKAIWMVPAYIAIAILVIFTLLFKEKSNLLTQHDQ